MDKCFYGLIGLIIVAFFAGAAGSQPSVGGFHHTAHLDAAHTAH